MLDYRRKSKMQPVERIDWTRTLNETSFDPPMPPAKGIVKHNLRFKDMDSYNAIRLEIADWIKRNIFDE